MFLWITVNLRCAREEHTGFNAFGESEHVDRSRGRRFDGFDGIVLVVGWTCGTGKMVNLVHFDCDGFCDIMYYEAVC